MSAFLQSLKSDLLDRRLMAVLALLGAALLGAIVYAVLASGGGSTASPAASAPATAPKAAGIAVSAVTAAKAPVAETTSGSSEQTGGSSHNPFTPLPGVKSASSSTAAAGGSGSSTSGSSSKSSASGGEAGSSTGSAGSGSETNSSAQNGGTQPEEKKAAKQGKSYKVSVLFGTAPAGTPALTAGLTSYEDLKRQEPLPSATQPLIVFRGVIAGGESATFTLVGEAILRGSAACLPSASQCQAIDLKAGQTEELEYVPLGGTAVTYELHVVKIEAIKAKAAKAAKAASATGAADVSVGESKLGLKFLRKAGLKALPGLRYSSDGSVLVFVGAAHASAARAHASAWSAAFKG
ncbi:MAG: hypothetical protein ACHQHO_00415 [Solirubrobacterales bacterium]